MSEMHVAIAQAKQIELSMEQAEIASDLSNFAGAKYESELARLFFDGRLDRTLLTYLVPRAWRFRQDRSPVPVETWRAMFEACSYTKDFVPTRRPRTGVTAFRGATPANRDGLAWTLDIRQARYFAWNRQDPHGPPAQVWVCRIPADRMLGRIVQESFENEVIADARGLPVRDAEPLSPYLRTLIRARAWVAPRSF